MRTRGTRTTSTTTSRTTSRTSKPSRTSRTSRTSTTTTATTTTTAAATTTIATTTTTVTPYQNRAFSRSRAFVMVSPTLASRTFFTPATMYPTSPVPRRSISNGPGFLTPTSNTYHREERGREEGGGGREGGRGAYSNDACLRIFDH